MSTGGIVTRSRIETLIGAALLAVVSVAAGVSLDQPADASGRARQNDFNGDGVEDLAVTVLYEVRGDDQIGGVHIFYSADGVSDVPDDHVLTMRTDGMGPVGRHSQGLAGLATAAGDFNRDGYADLAMSVSSYDYGQLDPNAGAVQVVYGSRSGLQPLGRPRAKLWTQASEGVQGEPEDGDGWGKSLAAGDFDGDHFDDLAIGAPGEAIGAGEYEGQLTVLYGSSNGVTARDQLWSQDTPGVLDSSERNDVMAHSLAAGDLNGDGADDIAAGVLMEDLSGTRNIGAVNVLYGEVGVGLTASRDRFLSQNSEGIGSPGEPWDMFGTILAIGNFDGDQYADLAIGAPGEDEGGVRDRGIATVLFGSQWGVKGTRSQTLRLNQLPRRDEYLSSLDDLQFSLGLAAGDVNGDGRAELAVGTPGYDDRRGRVDVLSGIAQGLSTSDVTLLRNTTGGPPPYQNGDSTWPSAHFGEALFFGRLDTQPGKDLAVSAPGATFNLDGTKYTAAGAVHVFGTREGQLGERGARVLHQAKAGVDSGMHDWERFGHTFPGSGSDWE